MNYDVFIHGVPKGHDCWGENDERDFFKLFYKPQKGTQFIIETRKVGNKSYCYYSYLKYDNVSDVDSRSGGYFGITIRFDMYCKDYNDIHTILESAYKNKVLGLLLQDNKNNIKYIVNDFISKDKEIKGIENDIGKSISLLCPQKSFIAIDNSFQLQSDKYVPCNPLDCTEEKILSDVKKYSKVVILDTILTNREKITEQKCNKIVSEVDKECNKKIEEAKQEVSRKIKQTEADYNKLNSDLKAKNVQIEQLKASNKSATDDLSKIKGILDKYESSSSKDQKEKTNNSSKSNLLDDNWFKRVILLLFVVVIIMQIILLFAKPTQPAVEYISNQEQNGSNGNEESQSDTTTVNATQNDEANEHKENSINTTTPKTTPNNEEVKSKKKENSTNNYNSSKDNTKKVEVKKEKKANSTNNTASKKNKQPKNKKEQSK